MTLLESLSKKFTAPGRIAFRDGPCGAPIIVLVAPHGSCEVALYGAHVLSYRPLGHSPVLWMAKSMMDTKPGKAIRGGIPVCWPWFGAAPCPAPDGSPLPAHGFARTQVWTLRKTEYGAQETTVFLTLDDSEATRALWPHRFHLELTVTVGERLDVTLETTNRDAAPFEITEALHSYFRVTDIAETKVRGLSGLDYLDKAPGGRDATQGGDIAFTSETDRVFPNATDSAAVIDEGLRRVILVEKQGSSATVVWNPWAEKAAKMADLAADDYLRFVCVETANCGGAPVAVAPGASHSVTAHLSAALLDKDGKPVMK